MGGAIALLFVIGGLFAIWGLSSIDHEIVTQISPDKPWLYFVVVFGVAVLCFASAILLIIAKKGGFKRKTSNKKKKGLLTNLLRHHSLKIVVSILTVVFFPGYMYVFVWAYGHNTGNPIIAGIITAVIFAIYLKFMPNERYEIIKPYLKSCSPKGKNQVEAARQIWNLYNASRYHQQLVLIYTLLIALLAVESLLFLILIDIFCLAFLISCAVLLLGYCKKEFNLDLPDLYFIDCFGKEWQETVCPICGTIGCNNLGSANYKNGSYTAERVFGTKTSDVTVEGETYHVKQNTSDILIHEHYSYDKIYYCPNCKKKYEKHHSGRVQVL